MSDDVRFASVDGVRLTGSLTVPSRSDGRLPGLVLIGGSGRSDRHNGGFFDDLVGHLGAAGIAVLAYDKRGAGGSGGEWATADVNLLAADAAAAFAFLREHPAIASENLGLLGHSEGGWVALRAATRLVTPRYLVLNSCPAVSFQQSEVYALSKAGVDQQVATSLMRRLGKLADAGASSFEAHRAVVGDADEAIRAAAAEVHFELTRETWAQFLSWSDYDPSNDLCELVVATLATYGEKDDVTPVEDSTARLQALAGPVVRAAVFANADHRLRVASDYAPDYLNTLSDWCLQGAG